MRSILPPIAYGSIFFAPMEGITDEAFRKTILKLYPEWDYLACDFLRVPSAGKYPRKHLIRHAGKDLFEIPWVMEKTMYQILTSHTAFTAELVRDLEELQIPWVDLNLGCPSNTVCKSGGGSSLLKDLVRLRPLVKTVRDNFKGRFSAKVRVGFDSPEILPDIISMLNDEGVELITVHARTREQMYKEPANWKHLETAVRLSKVPIIGNGDIWETGDIDRMLKDTGCHGVMVARGALKSPWMAQDYRQGHYFEKRSERVQRMKDFFNELRAQLELESISDRGLLKQSKSVIRFMLDGMDGGETIRRQLMLSQTAPDFYSILQGIS